MTRERKGMVERLPSLLALLLLCLSVSMLISETEAQDISCKKPAGTQDNAVCVCETEDGGIIDLNALVGKNGKPRFNGTKDDLGYIYSYNPCTAFTDITDAMHQKNCKNVYVCQTLIKSTGNVFDVGSTLDPTIYQNATSKAYYLKYKGSGGRQTQVNLHCDQSTVGKITSATQPAGSHVLFQLSSCHACPGGCKIAAGVAAGIVGIVIIIVILVALVIYFIVGGLLMKFHYQATGTDIIPNKVFWIQLPLLIKDGCVFTVSPIVKLVRSSKNDYQKI